MTTVIYARQSLDRDGEGAAVSRQISECRALASSLGKTVSREYVDNDVSATKGNRPAFNELVDDIRHSEVTTVIVWHTDRLYRRLRDLVQLVELAETHPLQIVTVKAGTVDLNSPSGRMFASMLGTAARYEVEQKGARQVAANVQRAKNGVWHFSSRPYGYERVDGEVRIVEREAEIIREAVRRVVDGESWYAIAKDFTARGVMTPSGRPFTYQNLAKVVSKPAVAGIRTYRGEVATEQGNWEPIIDSEAWTRFQTVIANRRTGRDWSKAVKYLGSGIYTCGKCGLPMQVQRDYAHGKRTRTPIYVCTALHMRRNQANVDALVEATVLERLSMPDVRSMLAPSEDAAELAAESRDIRQRIDGLAELFADGVLTAIAVREQKDKLQRRLDDLQGRLNAIHGATVYADLVSAKSVEDYWHTSMSVIDKRRIVAALVTVTIMPTKRGGRNEFRPEDVVIRWKGDNEEPSTA